MDRDQREAFFYHELSETFIDAIANALGMGYYGAAFAGSITEVALRLDDTAGDLAAKHDKVRDLSMNWETTGKEWTLVVKTSPEDEGELVIF